MMNEKERNRRMDRKIKLFCVQKFEKNIVDNMDGNIFF